VLSERLTLLVKALAELLEKQPKKGLGNYRILEYQTSRKHHLHAPNINHYLGYPIHRSLKDKYPTLRSQHRLTKTKNTQKHSKLTELTKPEPQPTSRIPPLTSDYQYPHHCYPSSPHSSVLCSLCLAFATLFLSNSPTP
jgi:hypothetical protein